MTRERGGVAVGIASRHGEESNPLLKRCLESLRTVDAGMSFALRLEVSPALPRGEKRQRVFTWAEQRGYSHVVILEDDTTIVSAGWLRDLMATAWSIDQVGMINPMETKDGFTPLQDALVHGKTAEMVTCFGFCILYSLAWRPHYDPRITYLDDVAMSLQCRAAGWRLVLCGTTMVQHTKEPFLRDDLPPWEQGDRARWGATSSYYQKERHDQTRLHEAKILIGEYGDMALGVIPTEILQAIAEEQHVRVPPSGVEEKDTEGTLLQPGKLQ